MKKVQLSKLAYALLLAAYLFAGCEFDLPTDSKGPGPINVGPGSIKTKYEYTAEENFELTVPVSSASVFSLEGVNGSVFIKHSSSYDEYRILAEKRVEARTQAEANEALKNLDVLHVTFDGMLHVRTAQPSDNYESEYTVDYTIYAPANTDIELTLTNGHAVLESISGNVTAEIMNGRITAEVAIPSKGYVDMAVNNGDVNLNIPQSTSARFSAKVGHGSISLSNIVLADRSESEKKLTGTMGSGDGQIKLELTNGDISVF